MAPEVLGIGGAVEQREEGQVLEPRACLQEIGRRHELLDEGEDGAHRLPRPRLAARPARRARVREEACVSLT